MWFRWGKTPNPKKSVALDESEGKILATDKSVKGMESQYSDFRDGSEGNNMVESKLMKPRKSQTDSLLSKTLRPVDNLDLKIKNMYVKGPHPESKGVEEMKFDDVGEISGHPKAPFMKPDNIVDESKFWLISININYLLNMSVIRGFYKEWN
jgi:hypothetical protein